MYTCAIAERNSRYESKTTKHCRDHYFCVESVTMFVPELFGPIWNLHFESSENGQQRRGRRGGTGGGRRRGDGMGTRKHRRKKGKEEEKEEDEEPVPDESVVTGHGEYDMASRPFPRLWQRLHA